MTPPALSQIILACALGIILRALFQDLARPDQVHSTLRPFPANVLVTLDPRDAIQADLASRALIPHFAPGWCFRLAFLPDMPGPNIRLSVRLETLEGRFRAGQGFAIAPTALTLATMAAAAGGTASADRDKPAGE